VWGVCGVTKKHSSIGSHTQRLALREYTVWQAFDVSVLLKKHCMA
jgi:hypothetical protein